MQRDSQFAILSSMTLTGTTVSDYWTPAVAVEIISWGFIITTALSGTPMVVTGDKRITAGSATGAITGTAIAGVGFGIMSPTAAQITAAIAGTVMRSRPTPSVTGEQKSRLFPGQQMSLKPSTAMGTTGVALPFIEYKIADEKQQLTAAMNLSTFGSNVAIGLGNEQEVDA